MAFVFYDTETTGSDPLWDQILQFAAILTDDELNPIERFNIRCRLHPHVVPSPGALVVTGVTIGQLTDPALPSHYQMMRAIHARLVSWSPTVFAGYNSFEFDEVLLREALYETLHLPDLTTTGGNARADVMQLVLATEQFHPGALRFHQRHDGMPSFRLDKVAPANGFSHDNPHEALADVEATIFVARLIRSKSRGFWDHMIGLGNKQAAINDALAEPLRLYTEFHHNRPHHWLVSPLALDPDHNGLVIAYDLAIPPEEVAGLDDEAFVRRMHAVPKPLRPIKASYAPFLQPWTAGRGLAEGAALGEAELRRRASFIHDEAAFRARLLQAYVAAKKLPEPPAFVEAQVEEGTPSEADQRRMAAFHAAGWTARLDLASHFEDRRLRQLALRLIYLEKPETIDDSTISEIEKTVAHRLSAPEKVPWLTLSRAIDEADALLDRIGGADGDRLLDLMDYLKTRQAWAERILDER